VLAERTHNIFQDIDFTSVARHLEKHQPHLSQEHQQAWWDWLHNLQQDVDLYSSGQQPFCSSILTQYHASWRGPSVTDVHSGTLAMIQGAHLSTDALDNLSATSALKAWMPWFKPPSAARHETVEPAPESRFRTDGSRRSSALSLSGMELIEAAAPPDPDATYQPRVGQETEDVVVNAPIQVGNIRRRKAAPKNDIAQLRNQDMIVMLRPLDTRTKSQPFWLCQAKLWDKEKSSALVQWFGAVDEDVPWRQAVWGEAMETLTQEKYDDLPPEHKGKGKYVPKNIGKAVYDSCEVMELQNEFIFHFGFRLSKGGKFPVSVSNELERRLRLENVQYPE
jgi:hypothetical protein